MIDGSHRKIVIWKKSFFVLTFHKQNITWYGMLRMSGGHILSEDLSTISEFPKSTKKTWNETKKRSRNYQIENQRLYLVLRKILISMNFARTDHCHLDSSLLALLMAVAVDSSPVVLSFTLVSVRGGHYLTHRSGPTHL